VVQVQVQVEVKVRVYAGNFHGPGDIPDPNRGRNRYRDFKTGLAQRQG
jgi:hypothetical protein